MPNHLANEKSPYLLQHQHNPVDWYPWGDAAFAKARQENKPIFLSIGYSTCHWCHVMEADSFEREDAAEVLNRYFISIKVDREERPDIDQIYMDVVVAMTGRGGWPMSVFLTPELKPFFGGTFFWRVQFIELLHRINELWIRAPERIQSSGDDIIAHLKKANTAAASPATPLTEEIFEHVLHAFEQTFDAQNGGFGGAPKFPKAIDLALLLRLYRRTGTTQALHMAETTLEKMARGGIYDHLGGGFHRYATDARWLVPHFEKMLYDNALLVPTYLEAYQLTQKPFYAAVAREILDYSLREMTSPEGGFYSAQDADSATIEEGEKEEGAFYVWTETELRQLLTQEEFDLFRQVYGLTPQGNFEHATTILSLQPDFDWLIKRDPRLESATDRLLRARDKRPHPHKDDKILTAWNGLMIAAMAKGAQVLGDDRYLQAARAAARFIRDRLYRDGKLLRRYRDGDSRHNGYAEDYAFLIHGLLALSEASAEVEWRTWATSLMDSQMILFWDTAHSGFFFSEKTAPDLFITKKDSYDGATPSSNSVSAFNLIRLYQLTLNQPYLETFNALSRFMAPQANQHPTGCSQFLLALDFYWSAGCDETGCTVSG